jgi:putative spermidine/putrescine transport system permease protein
MSVAASSTGLDITIDGVPLKVKLRRVERARQLKALGLIGPLFLFLLITFIVPIFAMLLLSVKNPEVPEVMPRTAAAIQAWDGEGTPDATVVQALVEDLREAHAAKTHGKAAKRLNYDISGFRSLVIKTARDLAELESEATDDIQVLISIDPRWGENDYWAAIKNAAAPYTPFYLLAALDRTRDVHGNIQAVPPEESVYVDVLQRTFWISFVVTVFCLALGYPLAYLLATLPTRMSNLLMILVLLPFWTSLLVRTTAWTILLQEHGIVNDAARFLGLWRDPVQLVHNRIGVYVAMVHILLPFMVLPLYSVMKTISPTHMRAAASLGAPPSLAFWRVYMPQSVPGIAAGCLLVFILALGYYITPALVGGPRDQMLSYFIALFTNQTINWGMAAALSVILLTLVLVLFAVYNRLIGAENMKLG